MKVANKVDAMAKAGNKEAQKNQKEAVDNLLRQTGIIATSATQAVMFGRAAHNRPPHRKNIVQQQSRNLNVTSNSVRQHKKF